MDVGPLHPHAAAKTLSNTGNGVGNRVHILPDDLLRPAGGRLVFAIAMMRLQAGLCVLVIATTPSCSRPTVRPAKANSPVAGVRQVEIPVAVGSQSLYPCAAQGTAHLGRGRKPAIATESHDSSPGNGRDHATLAYFPNPGTPIVIEIQVPVRIGRALGAQGNSRPG